MAGPQARHAPRIAPHSRMCTTIQFSRGALTQLQLQHTQRSVSCAYAPQPSSATRTCLLVTLVALLLARQSAASTFMGARDFFEWGVQGCARFFGESKGAVDLFEGRSKGA